MERLLILFLAGNACDKELPMCFPGILCYVDLNLITVNSMPTTADSEFQGTFVVPVCMIFEPLQYCIFCLFVHSVLY
jgi:hypothetical protein